MKQSGHFKLIYAAMHEKFRYWPQRAFARRAYKEGLEHAKQIVKFVFVNADETAVEDARVILSDRLHREIEGNGNDETSMFSNYFKTHKAMYALQDPERLALEFYKYGLEVAHITVETTFLPEATFSQLQLNGREMARNVFLERIMNEHDANDFN